MAFFRRVTRFAISDGFGGRGGAVIHRGIGHIHAGQQGHLGLELEQILQRALRHFRLVGRVGGEELAALDQVIDRGRDMVPIGAGAQEARRTGWCRCSSPPWRR